MQQHTTCDTFYNDSVTFDISAETFTHKRQHSMFAVRQLHSHVLHDAMSDIVYTFSSMRIDT